MPALPAPLPPLSDCTRRYGATGCAARLYGEVLCEIIGTPADLHRIEQQLGQRFAAEQVLVNGITAEQVETAAVRYYVPQLCPTKSRRIWNLMLPGEAG